MEDQLNCTNPFTGKKRRKGVYITKKRRDQIDKYNKGELNDKEARDVEVLVAVPVPVARALLVVAPHGAGEGLVVAL